MQTIARGGIKRRDKDFETPRNAMLRLPPSCNADRAKQTCRRAEQIGGDDDQAARSLRVDDDGGLNAGVDHELALDGVVVTSRDEVDQSVSVAL